LAVEFSIKRCTPEKQRTACAVVGVHEGRRLDAAARSLDDASGGYLGEILKRGDMEGKCGSTLLLHAVPGVPCERVLLVGLGKKGEFAEKAYCDALRAAMRVLLAGAVRDAVIYLAAIPVRKRDAAWAAERAVSLAMEVAYRFDSMKSQRDPAPVLGRIVLACADKAAKSAMESGLARGLAIARGANLARDLGNLPGNVCTPTYLAEQAAALAERHGLGLDVLEQADMERLGMGALLSVAKGSEQPPKLIVLRYGGGRKGDKPVVLVGKGITFDSGGISIKPAAEMDEMKYDMCGAASVLGSLQAAAEMALPLNVVGIIPTCENMPSGRANKPGDVVTSMSGQTIEVLNTDAEGRLILCDALTYAEGFEPAAVVDIATLTGACVIALGHVATGLLANRQTLANELIVAGDASGDRCWQLPLWEEYQDLLKSNFADMANIGGRAGGTITAAAFLSRFAKKYDWAHLDIAGTAWKSGKDKGGTGRPVPLLVHFLSARAGR